LDIVKLKETVAGEIDTHHRELADISRRLHDTAEVAFKEHRSAALLVEFLERNGFAVEKGICKLSTAFRALYGSGKPVIAFLAEYDALPKLGHACGHNLIATGPSMSWEGVSLSSELQARSCTGARRLWPKRALLPTLISP
jgi:metal-dependent amidase/aminoacylase/carboxypeptidase family protein